MSRKIPGADDWPDLLQTAREQGLSETDDTAAVSHGQLASAVSDQCDVPSQTASRWIDNAVTKDWLQRRGSGADREYVAVDGAGSLYDTAAIDDLLGEDDLTASEVQAALATAVDYYHDQLGGDERWLISGKWGIDDDTINDLKIGYAPPRDDNDLPGYLRDEDVRPAAALRAGVVRSPSVSYVYGADPSTDDSPVGLPDKLDELAAARAAGEVAPEEISLTAVLEAVREAASVRLYDWWDARIIFPYRDEEGVIRYLIARKTGKTDDVPGKYIKLANTKPWVDDTVVSEPIYGCHTVEDGCRLILTEGITDAIAGHEAGYSCISPVTKQFKREHYDILRGYADQAATAYLCFDSEETEIGLENALRTAWFLADHDVDARVAELPRGGDEKVDLADYLQDHHPDDLDGVLEEGVPPTEHPAFQPGDHSDASWADILTAADTDDEAEASLRATVSHLCDRYGVDADRAREWINAAAGDAIVESDSPGATTYTPASDSGTSGPDDDDGPAASGDDTSALFDLSIQEVIRGDSRHGVSLGYRGDNPLGHVGDSHSDYFIYERYKGDARARDFKTEHSYTALTWLACAAGERSPEYPAGSLDDTEIWASWRYAKREGILAETDPVPWRGRLHIAREHDLAPQRLIEQATDDPSMLPPSIHNRILDTIEDEYGLNPGMDPLDVDHEDEQRGEFLAGGDDSAEADESADEGSEKGGQVKRMLATLDEVED